MVRYILLISWNVSINIFIKMNKKKYYKHHINGDYNAFIFMLKNLFC